MTRGKSREREEEAGEKKREVKGRFAGALCPAGLEI